LAAHGRAYPVSDLAPVLQGSACSDQHVCGRDIPARHNIHVADFHADRALPAIKPPQEIPPDRSRSGDWRGRTRWPNCSPTSPRQRARSGRSCRPRTGDPKRRRADPHQSPPAPPPPESPPRNPRSGGGWASHDSATAIGQLQVAAGARDLAGRVGSQLSAAPASVVAEIDGSGSRSRLGLACSRLLGLEVGGQQQHAADDDDQPAHEEG
jgi:hypothetical protein